MSDLVAFLRARLDEDEAAAWSIHDVSKCDALLYEEDMAAAARRDPDCDCGRPDRERREVAAKRAILASLEEEKASRLALRDSMATEGNRSYQEGFADTLGECLYRLRRQWAAVYSDHPDYDEAWRP